MAKMRRSANHDPARAAEIMAGPRLDHRGRTWHEWNDWDYDDWDKYYDEGSYGAEREPTPGPPQLEWREGPEHILPHVRDQIDEHNGRWAETRDENSLHNSFWPAVQQQTAIREHGETRYGLDVGDEGFDIGGWLWHYRLHRQTGPDADNPDHWEQIPSGNGIITSDALEDPGHAKVVAERELQKYIDHKEKSRPGIGDYDINKLMRDEGL
jgi:hypothetical protein